MERTPPSFRHAERFVGELTDRQRDVLRLIAVGKTNSEIAEELGMTLSGAKWHVSELLTKLGLDVREEAAAFYRWRQRRTILSRTMRALFGFGLVRPAIISGALVLAAMGVAIALAAVGDKSAPPELPGRPFYLEAQRTDTLGPGQDPQVATTRWWHEDPTHERTEVFSSSSPFSFSLSVTDGADTWSWTSASNFYTRLPRQELGCTACHSFGVGPVDAPDFQTYLSELQIRDSTTLTVGNKRILGRRTIGVERAIDPANRFRITEWIDPERLIVMRSVANDPENQIGWTAEVTELEYDTVLAPTLFRWSPPPGLLEDKCARMTLKDLPGAGFPVPIVSSSGYRLHVFGAERDSTGTCSQAHVDYATGDGGTLQVGENREDPGSVITGPRDDPHEVIPNVTAYAWQEPGYTLLAWVHDGLGIQLKSDTLTVDDLLTFARDLLFAASTAPPTPTTAPSP